MSSNEKHPIREFAEHCKRKIEEFENTRVNCALIGTSGSGKSSLTNAIVGEKIAAVGVTETTNQPQSVTHKGIVFTDLPGCGTKTWPRDSYVSDLGLGQYDCLLLITADRLTENDVFLHRELERMGKHCFILRNKMDLAVADAAHDNNLSEEETLRQVEEDIRRQLTPDAPQRIYLTSAREPARFDLKQLLVDISETLNGSKQDRFVADMAAYGREALKKKREVALRQVPLYAGLSAANGLNPIPGVDVAADVGLLVKLAKAIAEVYGLTDKRMEYVAKLLGPRALAPLLAKATQFAAKYFAKQGILLLLKRIAARTTAKHVSKWVPFVGPLVSAGIGWKATFMLGEQLVDEAEAILSDIQDESIRETGNPGAVKKN